MQSSNQAKILFIDIETAPNLALTFGTREQDISHVQIVREKYIMMIGYKWLGDKRPSLESLHYDKNFIKDRHNDKPLAKLAYALLDEADIVIAHNGDSFDIKHLNSLFLRHIGRPPSPFKSVDTLTASRSNFYENSHKLNDQCSRYGIGSKAETGGFELWKECYLSDNPKKHYDKMAKYCKHDVELLEGWYFKIRPFIKKHPNVALYSSDEAMRCEVCGSTHINLEGYAYLASGKYHRYSCKSCGHWGRGRQNLLSKTKKSNLLAGA